MTGFMDVVFGDMGSRGFVIADTDFVGNAVAVDPVGCGCTDCIVGNSVPIDDARMVDVGRDYFNGRQVINRSSGFFAFTWMSDGSVKVDIDVADADGIRPVFYSVIAPR